jgi:uncharacterized protein DUF4388
MAVEGTLDLFRLPEILQLVAQQKKTGILTVQGQQDIVAISFLNGRIVAADALNQTMEEGLARVLVAEGLLSREQMARASAEHQAAGGRLLDLLVEHGYLERLRLLEGLRLQTRQLVEQLLRWDEGDFKFYSGEEVSYEDAFVPITVEEVLLHGAEAIFEEPPARPRPAAPRLVAAPEPPAAQPTAGAERDQAAEPPRRPRAVPRPAALEAPPGPRPVAPPAGPRPAAGRAAAGGSKTVAEPAPAAEAPAAAGPSVFRRMKVEEAAVPRSHRVAARLLALAPAILLVGVLTQVPDQLVLPFPWQDGQRAALAGAQRIALFLKIDRAAKTFCLIEGTFPGRLSQLHAAGLLSAGDLVDPQGQPLAYRSQGDRYLVEPLDDRGAPLPGAEASEASTGNFLLDPKFTAVSPDSQVPLVLLD